VVQLRAVRHLPVSLVLLSSQVKVVYSNPPVYENWWVFSCARHGRTLVGASPTVS